MDDLVQLVFFGLLILFGVLSSQKKKKHPPPPQPKPRVRSRSARDMGLESRIRARDQAEQASRPPVRRPAAPARPSPAAAEAKPRDLAQELMQFLQGRVPAPSPPPAEPAPPAPEPAPSAVDEARSLEQVALDRKREHKRFHEEYVEHPTPAPEPAQPARRYRLARSTLSRSDLRHAFVMKEVLGPPKALDVDH